jgi:hypothetical protein
MHDFEHIVAFRDEGLPSGFVRLGNVDGQETAARGVAVRLEVKVRAIVADKGVGGFEVRNQFHHFPIGL